MQRGHSSSIQGGGKEWPEGAATVASVKVFQREWWLEVTVSDHLSLCKEWPQLLWHVTNAEILAKKQIL